jgi:hypothetical protein
MEIQVSPLVAAAVAAAAAAGAGVGLSGLLPGPVSAVIVAATGGVIAAGLALIALDRSLNLGLVELARWVRGAGHDNRAP